MAGVSGFTSPLEAVDEPLRRRTAEEGGPEPPELCTGLAATGFLAEKEPIEPGLAITGVGGVMKVVGVPTGGGVMTGSGRNLCVEVSKDSWSREGIVESRIGKVGKAPAFGDTEGSV